MQNEPGGFEQALEETAHAARKPDAECSLTPKIHVPEDLGLSPGGGGEARWRMAMSWCGDPETSMIPLPRAPLPALPLEDCESIRRELGLDLGLSMRELVSRRRAFLWRNHPDRLPAEKREGAHARVAIANALFDEAAQDREGPR